MSVRPLPFLTGPAPSPDTAAGFKPSPPTDNLVSVSPLSKAQMALWFDYLQHPTSTHYFLTLKVELDKQPLSLDKIIQGMAHSSCPENLHMLTGNSHPGLGQATCHAAHNLPRGHRYR